MRYWSSLHVGFLYCLQLLLEGPDDILAFEFCPSDPNIIVGGCINGQVLRFPLDCRNLPSPVPSLYAGGSRSKLIIHQTRLVVAVVVACCHVISLLLLLFQVVLWDISAHVTVLHATEKKVSDEDKFVGIPALHECVFPFYQETIMCSLLVDATMP